MERCDDCRVEYEGPAYYTFPEEACKTTILVVFVGQHANCTGNIGPCCADGLMPDDPADRRQPSTIYRS